MKYYYVGFTAKEKDHDMVKAVMHKHTKSVVFSIAQPWRSYTLFRAKFENPSNAVFLKDELEKRFKPYTGRKEDDD